MIDAKFHKSELKTSDFINSFMGPLFFETVGIMRKIEKQRETERENKIKRDRER